MADPLTIAGTVALTYAISRPHFKIWLPGLPVPIEFDNPLFKTTEGQRLGDLQIQETAEGAPENRCFGPKNRVAGALVWMSDLKEVKKSESGGGKGGSGGEFITYQYFAHLMVRSCRARTPISGIRKIWADAKVLFDSDVSVAISSNGIDSKIESSIVNTNNLATGFSRNYLALESDIALARPDLSTVKSGGTAVVSGYTGGSTGALQLVNTPGIGSTTIPLRTASGTFALQVDDVIEFQGFGVSYSVLTGITVTTAGVTVALRNTILANRPTGSVTAPLPVVVKRGAQANNGTFSVISATKDPEPGGTQISRVKLTDQTNPFRKFVAVGTGTTLSVSQTNPTFKASQVGEISILTGGPDQAVPDILQQVEGGTVTQVYAMRNRAGFVLRDLNLTDFANRVPNLEALVEVTADPGKVADAIKTVLMDDAEWPESAIDVSGVSGEFLGFQIRGPQPPRRSLLPLLIAFDIAQWERGGKIFYATRSSIAETVIPPSEVGAFVGTQEKRGLQIEDQARDFLPSQIQVSYRSQAKEYQTATKPSSRTEQVPSNIRGLDLSALVISDDLAQQIADRMMAIAWGAQHRLTMPLPQSRAGVVREGMILRSGPIYGQTWRMFVERVDRGANMLVVASGQEYDPALMIQTQTAEGSLGLSASGNSQDGGKTVQPHAELFLLDIPSIRDGDRHEPGIYLAARSGDPFRPWRGGVLYWSRDFGVTWNRVADVLTEAVTGELVTGPTISVLPGLWDRANTIRVRIRHTQAQLGSVSEDACLSGANRFLVGKEIIGAARVVYVSRDPVDGSRLYDLSTLLRGQQNTEQEMESHVANEAVVWLDGPGVDFLSLSYSHVDNERLWRLVPHGGLLEQALEIQVAATGRNVKPYHVELVGERDGGGNLTLTLNHTSRAATNILDQGRPIDEEEEAYEVDVIFSGSVVRTLSVTGSNEIEYTAADQTADGITPFDPITFRPYQISAGFLRGQESEYDI